MSLQEHLETGVTTLAHAWAVVRTDGFTLGFTDHDRDLSFEGIHFSARSGMTARVLQQTTGLAVDNTEAIGALTADSISESDIRAGRYDAASVRIWLVNWTDVNQRRLEFRGTFGEVVRSGSAFRVELRGLSESLSRPGGRLFQRACTSVLGDDCCRVDVSRSEFSSTVSVDEVSSNEFLTFSGLDGFAQGWFEKGFLRCMSGEAMGLTGSIKTDVSLDDGRRKLGLWQKLRATVREGDVVRVVAGCDKQPHTCRNKFANFLNFQGFPHIPGEDWLMAVPRRDGLNDGGRLK